MRPGTFAVPNAHERRDHPGRCVLELVRLLDHLGQPPGWRADPGLRDKRQLRGVRRDRRQLPRAPRSSLPTSRPYSNYDGVQITTARPTGTASPPTRSRGTKTAWRSTAAATGSSDRLQHDRHRHVPSAARPTATSSTGSISTRHRATTSTRQHDRQQRRRGDPVPVDLPRARTGHNTFSNNRRNEVVGMIESATTTAAPGFGPGARRWSGG